MFLCSFTYSPFVFRSTKKAMPAPLLTSPLIIRLYGFLMFSVVCTLSMFVLVYVDLFLRFHSRKKLYELVSLFLSLVYPPFFIYCFLFAHKSKTVVVWIITEPTIQPLILGIKIAAVTNVKDAVVALCGYFYDAIMLHCF